MKVLKYYMFANHNLIMYDANKCVEITLVCSNLLTTCGPGQGCDNSHLVKTSGVEQQTGFGKLNDRYVQMLNDRGVYGAQEGL